LVSSLVGQ